MAHLTIRQGEARALQLRHYDWRRRELRVELAMKGDGSRAGRGDTKTGEAGWYPVSDELAEWIERHRPEARFAGGDPVFANPRTGRPYSRKTIQALWRGACVAAEFEPVPPCRATKHSTLSELARDGVGLEPLQALARHRDVRTTRLHLDESASPRKGAQEARERVARGGAAKSGAQIEAFRALRWWAARDSNPGPSG